MSTIPDFDTQSAPRSSFIRSPLRFLGELLDRIFLKAVLILAAGHVVSLLLAMRGIGASGLTRQLVHLYAIGVAFAAIAIVSAVASDARTGARTDGLHYDGVSAWLWIAAVQLATYVAFLWF